MTALSSGNHFRMCKWTVQVKKLDFELLALPVSTAIQKSLLPWQFTAVLASHEHTLLELFIAAVMSGWITIEALIFNTSYSCCVHPDLLDRKERKVTETVLLFSPLMWCEICAVTCYECTWTCGPKNFCDRKESQMTECKVCSSTTCHEERCFKLGDALDRVTTVNSQCETYEDQWS